MTIMYIIVGILLFIIAILWLGLHIQPKHFPPYPGHTQILRTIPVPDGLPAPVDRFYRQVYGDHVPLIVSAVISGRARIRFGPIIFPGRFRFTYSVKHGYRHYIETTFFGLPLMKVNEHFLDGKSRLELPFEVVEGEPKVDQAANLGLWAEFIWLPSVWVTDPRAHWESIDDETASLFVPFTDTQQSFIIRFDPNTNLLRYLESMRYKDAESKEKTLWINEADGWKTFDDDIYIPDGAITWFDQGTPWAIFSVGEVVYNVEIDEYIKAKGA